MLVTAPFSSNWPMVGKISKCWIGCSLMSDSDNPEMVRISLLGVVSKTRYPLRWRFRPMKALAAAILLIPAVLAAHFAFGAPQIPASASGAQTSNSLPEGLSVRLAAPDGKTDFMMGEPIVLRLVFSSDRSGYQVNTTRMFGPSVTVNVSPAESVFR